MPIGHYYSLSTECVERTQKTRTVSKQALSLCKESIEYLSRPSLQIKSIGCVAATKPSGILYPFHQKYLEGEYGTGRSMKSKSARVAIQKFRPESVGDLKLPPNGWACIKCSTINEASRSLHVCLNCSCTPKRNAKLSAKVLSTSKYLIPTKDEMDSDDNESSSSSDYRDTGFCMMDE